MRNSVIVALFCMVCTVSAGAETPSAAVPPQSEPPSITGADEIHMREQVIANELIEESDRGYIAIAEEEANMYLLRVLTRLFVDPSTIAERSQIKFSVTNEKFRESFAGMFGIKSRDGSRYPSVIRVYSLPGDVTASLEELDFGAAGVTMMQVKEMINVDINGMPGTMTYRRTPSEKGLILISWLTPSRFLKLAVAGDRVGPEHRVVALELARSVREE